MPTPLPTPAIVASGGLLVNESCPPTNGQIDPGERVSINLKVMNNGTGSTTKLVGTLQTSGNVIAPGGPQNYGAIAPGDMASRTFSFTANGACGENITLSLQMQDGMTNLGAVIYRMTLGVNQQAVCYSTCQIARLVTTNVALSCVGGNVQADITLQNQGIVSATGVTLTQAQLGSPSVSGTLVPQGPFPLAPGATQNFTVTFSTACPFNGTKLLRLKGTSTNAGSWGSTSGVTSR